MNVAILMCFKDEADIIQDTLSRWLALGVTHFYLCDRESTDFSLAKVRNMDLPNCVIWERPQVEFDNHMVINEMAAHAYDAGIRWMIPCDADEWLWLPTGMKTVQDWFSMYEDVPCWGTIPYIDLLPTGETRWHTHRKVVARWEPGMVISIGNHEMWMSEHSPFWGNVIFTKNAYYQHMPIRSRVQHRRKMTNLMRAFANGPADNPRHHDYLEWQRRGDEVFEEFYQRELNWKPKWS